MNMYFREECCYCKQDVVEVAKAASIKTGPVIAGLDGYLSGMMCFVFSLTVQHYPYVGLNEHCLFAKGQRHQLWVGCYDRAEHD